MNERIRFTFPDIHYDEETGEHFDTGDEIEVELTAEQVAAGGAAYIVDDENAPLIVDDDGTVTRIDTTDKESTEQEEQPEVGPSDRDEDTATARLRREAARYRTQLRATEKERDSLLERVGGFQRAEVERQVTEPGGLETGADLWAGGVELADLLDGEGDLDTEAIKAAKAKVLEEHPAWRQPSPNFVGGVRGVPEPTPVSFGEQLKRAAG